MYFLVMLIIYDNLTKCQTKCGEAKQMVCVCVAVVLLRAMQLLHVGHNSRGRWIVTEVAP